MGKKNTSRSKKKAATKKTITKKAQSKSSCLDAWKRVYAKGIKDLKEILTWDPFENWKLSTRPEWECEESMLKAVEILYSGQGKSTADKYLKRGLERFQRCVDENKFRSKRCKDSFPRNRGAAVRAQQYAQALQGGELSAEALLSAAGDYQKWVSTCKWDEFAQSEILDAARMCLIAGDRARAAKLLSRKNSFGKHSAEHKLWKKLAATDSDLPISDDALLTQFDKLFDVIRVPDFKSDAYMNNEMVRFEMAVLRYKYFCSKSGEIDWKKAIKQVTRSGPQATAGSRSGSGKKKIASAAKASVSKKSPKPTKKKAARVNKKAATSTSPAKTTKDKPRSALKPHPEPKAPSKKRTTKNPQTLYGIGSKKGGGFINRQGEVVVEPVHYRLGDCIEDRAVFKKTRSSQWGYLDSQGNIVIEPAFDAADSFAEGLAGVEAGGRQGFIDPSGDWVFEIKKGDYYAFHEGLVGVELGKELQFLRRDGSVAFTVKGTSTWGFHDGLAAVEFGRNRHGFIDNRGEVVIPGPYCDAYSFCGGVARVSVRRDGEEVYGYINKNGEYTIEPTYTGADDFSEGLACVNSPEDESIYGYIDKKGKWVIPPQFESAESFSDGLACVRPSFEKDEVVYVDKKGKVVLRRECDYANSFQDGLAMLVMDRTRIYIDRKGKTVWEGSW